MMLAITMAPTISEMPEIRIITAKAAAEMDPQSDWTASAPTTPNGSSVRKGVLRSERRSVRTSPSVSSSPFMPRAGRTRMAMPSSAVMTFWRKDRGTKITLSRFCPRILPSLDWRPITRRG